MAPITLPVGSSDEFEEVRNVGVGGFGSVVKARHRATGKEVAIKRLLDEPGEEHSAAVKREASFLVACGDIPFVVRFHGLIGAPGSTELRLVMECLGPSLRDVLIRRGDGGAPPLSESVVRSVMRQLLWGAKEMHRRHVVHRDIKPDNILISMEQRAVKICDFGLAIHLSEPPPYRAMGSPWYMAPEVLLGKNDYDTLVDMWSLGCVMAELITGDILFCDLNGTAGQLSCIIEVLGVPDARTWPWFTSTPFATQVLPHAQRQNMLRDRLPMLSEQGFEVLSGLLTWNPDQRLTARAALQLPWFAAELHGAPAAAPPARGEQEPSASKVNKDP